ncbi:glycoside hydrolase family 16 protein [Mycolicibacterium thermoresistibile]
MIAAPYRRRCAGVLLTLVVLLVGGCADPTVTGRADPARPEAEVIFVDDFDGPAGASPGSAWRFDTGGGGWGNNEMQIYTDDPANASLDGDGNLVLTARRDADGRITSARITTRDTVEFTTGRAAARVALPAGTGLHPAFWLLGANIDEVGWPASGEIDVIETLNQADRYHTGVHAPQTGSPRGQEVSTSGPAPFPLAGEFRTYWVERSAGKIVTGIDDVTLFTVTPKDLEPGARWVFDAPFYLLLNLAVGGDWPGPPDASTPFPVQMVIDWVRVTAL